MWILYVIMLVGVCGSNHDGTFRLYPNANKFTTSRVDYAECAICIDCACGDLGVHVSQHKIFWQFGCLCDLGSDGNGNSRSFRWVFQSFLSDGRGGLPQEYPSIEGIHYSEGSLRLRSNGGHGENEEYISVWCYDVDTSAGSGGWHLACPCTPVYIVKGHGGDIYQVREHRRQAPICRSRPRAGAGSVGLGRREAPSARAGGGRGLCPHPAGPRHEDPRGDTRPAYKTSLLEARLRESVWPVFKTSLLEARLGVSFCAERFDMV